MVYPSLLEMAEHWKWFHQKDTCGPFPGGVLNIGNGFTKRTLAGRFQAGR